jgi:hypothetical protein
MACWRQGPKGRGSWVVTPVTDRGDMRGNLPLHPLHALHRVFELWSLWRVFFYVFLVCAIQSIQDTTNFPNVHVHLPEIRRKAGLVGHTGHHYTTSTPHLAGQLRVGEAAQDRGPRRCLSHPWSMSITYHRTYHFNGSSMFKHVQTCSNWVMTSHDANMPTSCSFTWTKWCGVYGTNWSTGLPGIAYAL